MDNSQQDADEALLKLIEKLDSEKVDTSDISK